MEHGLAEQDSEYSTEGVMLHSLFLTGNRPDTLTPNQVELLDLADFYADEFFTNVRAKFDISEGEPWIDEREPEMVIKDASEVVLFPGHADVVRTWPRLKVRAIADAKFGFMEVDEAPGNLQLATYAVMRQQQSEAKAVAVAIIQPRNFGPRFTQAVYGASDLSAAEVEVMMIYVNSLKPDAELRAGPHCHFCKAKTICPAYTQMFAGIQKTVGTVAVETLPLETLEELFGAIKFAEKIGKDITAEMRRRVNEGHAPGWKLRNTGDVTVLDKTFDFYQALKGYFKDIPQFTPRAFDDCRVMGWGKLETLIQDITGLSDKKVKEFIKEMSEPFVTRTPKEKSVVREKAEKLLNP